MSEKLNKSNVHNNTCAYCLEPKRGIDRKAKKDLLSCICESCARTIYFSELPKWEMDEKIQEANKNNDKINKLLRVPIEVAEVVQDAKTSKFKYLKGPQVKSVDTILNSMDTGVIFWHSYWKKLVTAESLCCQQAKILNDMLPRLFYAIKISK